jgi:hypothetical protein
MLGLHSTVQWWVERSLRSGFRCVPSYWFYSVLPTSSVSSSFSYPSKAVTMNVDLEASSLLSFVFISPTHLLALDVDLDAPIAIVTLRWVTFHFVSLIELSWFAHLKQITVGSYQLHYRLSWHTELVCPDITSPPYRLIASCPWIPKLWNRSLSFLFVHLYWPQAPSRYYPWHLSGTRIKRPSYYLFILINLCFYIHYAFTSLIVQLGSTYIQSRYYDDVEIIRQWSEACKTLFSVARCTRSWISCRFSNCICRWEGVELLQRSLDKSLMSIRFSPAWRPSWNIHIFLYLFGRSLRPGSNKFLDQ